MVFTATFTDENGQDFCVLVEGESIETVAEYLCNCGEYEGSLLLSVE